MCLLWLCVLLTIRVLSHYLLVLLGVHRELGPRPAPWAMSVRGHDSQMLSKYYARYSGVLFAVGRIP